MSEFTRCGFVKGIFCDFLEAHPGGVIRNWATKKIIKGRLDNGDYPIISKFVGGRWRRIPLHRIMLETFKPQLWRNLECDHRNGDTVRTALQAGLLPEEFALGNPSDFS